MKILFMADVPPDPNRGAAGTEVQSVRALRALGHDVDTVWSDELGRRIGHGNLHLLLELPRAYERAATRRLRGGHYDVVHVNQPHGFRAARTVHRLSPSTIFVHRSHGIELNVERILQRWRRELGADERGAARKLTSRGIAGLLARHSYAIARQADGHVVSSSIDARFLEQELHVPPEKIAVIAQAAPQEYLRIAPPPMTAARLRRVLHVAQFAFFKAPMITAAAINRMAREPELQFTWVCDRADHERIRTLLTPEANARTELLHWTTQDELRAIYDAHGMFLFPSFFEGFGKAFIEAMSRGLCVIASDAGGMHDLIMHGRNGFLVPPGDAERLTETALAAIRAPQRAQDVSIAAAATAREHTWARVARELTAFYEARLIARRR
jgi:glycosyltransferase involved in cell wall biosynthesis